MNYTALWMDHQHAILLTFTKKNGTLDAETVSEENITADMPIDHHSKHPHDANSAEKEQHLVSFFHRITDKLAGVNQLLLMGPGISKNQFKNHCESHNHKLISKAILGLETMTSHPSRSELVAKAVGFFDSPQV